MTITDTDLSRAVSHALRHEPWVYEIELDEEGWTPVDQLLHSLREKGDGWESVDRSSLERMLTAATKRRHELDGDRIRALYGHSLTGGVLKRAAVPPARLFHGTAPHTWSTIQAVGLLPMRRQFVHLSTDRDTASSVGHRKSASPVMLVIDAPAASSDGVAFYAGNDLVWLADHVPARYITEDRGTGLDDS